MSNLGFVLLSGGIDSTTCLGFAVRDCGRGKVTAFSVDYGQRHAKEMEQAKKVAAYYSVPHEIIYIPGIPKRGLTDHNATIPDVAYADLKGVSPTYVPFRNGQFLSKLAAIAADRVQGYNDANPEFKHRGRIYFGAHAEDAAGDAYPDCRLDFVGAMGAAILIGTYNQVEVAAPLIQMYKDEIVTAGQKLGAPWHLTWSCYKGEPLHCGICPTCRARRDGFKKAGVTDPTEYASSIPHS